MAYPCCARQSWRQTRRRKTSPLKPWLVCGRAGGRRGGAAAHRRDQAPHAPGGLGYVTPPAPAGRVGPRPCLGTGVVEGGRRAGGIGRGGWCPWSNATSWSNGTWWSNGGLRPPRLGGAGRSGCRLALLPAADAINASKRPACTCAQTAARNADWRRYVLCLCEENQLGICRVLFVAETCGVCEMCSPACCPSP